jgi:prefoldin subunit 5
MEAMRESWTDDRLDHLSERMDERFDRVDERFRQMDERFRQVDQRLDRVETGLHDHRAETRAEFAAIRTTLDMRFDTTQYMLIRVGAGLFATIVVGTLSLLAAQL